MLFCLAFFCLVSLQYAIGQPLTLTMRKMYLAAAETQDAVAFLDDIYVAATRRLEQSPDFELFPVESLQQQAGGILRDDFDLRLDPIALLRIKQEHNVEVALFYYLGKKGADYYCRLTAEEFPSGVFIDETEFALQIKEKDFAAGAERIEKFLRHVKAEKADFGYPFADDETGLLIITDSYEDALLQGVLRGLQEAKKVVNGAGPSRLASKSVFYYFEGDSNYVDVANALLKASGAKAVLIHSEHSPRQIVVTPADQVKRSVLENKLPLWPPFEGFTVFHLDADSVFARDFGCSYYPQRSRLLRKLARYGGAKNDAAALLFYNTIRTLEDSLYRADELWATGRLDSTGALYDQLQQSGNSIRPEAGWIAINGAEFYYQAKRYADALDKLTNALSVFDSFSNQFGPLFVRVLQGQVYEDIHDQQHAADAYKAAVGLADSLRDNRTLAWLYFRLGVISLDVDRSFEAWDYFSVSAERYVDLGETETVVKLYTKIGVLLRQNKMLIKSREYLQQALDLATTLQNDRLIADAAYHLAATAEQLGESDEALARFAQAGDLMEILADSVNTANVEEHLGDIYFAQEQWRDAQAGFEYAARFYMYVDDIDGAVRCLVKSADVSVARKKWQRAQKTLDEALALANRRAGGDWPTIILQKKGLAHIKSGDYTAGEKELDLAKSKSLSRADVERYMKSLTRDLEAELDDLQPNRRK